MTEQFSEFAAERRCAMRALLQRPLLPACGETTESFLWVRRHADWLQQWLGQFPAWSLYIDRDLARLHKLPSNLADDTRPAIDRDSGTPFTRRRYALLCLALAALERSGRQSTLEQIAQHVTTLAASDPDLPANGVTFDVASHDHRRDLIHAVRLLRDNGVLRHLGSDDRPECESGGESALANCDWSASAEVFEINRHILVQMLQAARAPSTVEAPSHRAGRTSLQQRAARIAGPPATAMNRVCRTLLDDAVLYYAELDNEERIYLEKNRGFILREISEATGLIAEVRSEGIALLDRAADLSDVQLTSEDAAALRLPLDQVPNETLFRLRALRLVECSAEGIVPLAACARYSMVEA